MDDSARYKTIFLGPGSNNCSTNSPVEKTIDEYKQLLAIAKEKSESVVISSILPRNDNGTVNLKVREVNEKLKELSGEENVTFIDHDKNFRYGNGDHDDDLLLLDQVHLSEKGVNRLLKNLGLQDRAHFAKPSLNKTKQTTKRPSGKSLLFKQEKDELSNFYPCKLHVFDQEFKSSEAAYQYTKALENSDIETADAILEAPAAKEVKRLSHRITSNSGWYKKKVDVMKDILDAKLEQCQAFKQRLSLTGSLQLIEDTDYEYWGRGSDGRGKNMMGTLLMRLRESIVSKRNSSNTITPQTSQPQAPWQIVNYKRRQVTTRQHRRENDSERSCWNCGETNHMQKDCRHGQKIKCNSCGYRGHKAKFCTYY